MYFNHYFSIPRSMLSALILIFWSHIISAIELTFELSDNARECFFEDIFQGNSSVVEFQVITGGQYDVDVELSAPDKVLYKEIKKQYDSYEFTAAVTGTYSLCFSNEFSTFSHKSIYFDWQIGEDKQLFSGEKSLTPLTMMESASQAIHEKLKTIDDLQTHQRLRETTGRKSAEDLNDRVLYWSLGQTMVLIMIGIGQVVVLRSFFTEKRTGRF
uniref:GOLD domain-containing protein n=1 Tax=Romanomermis culicivorax TaxID=13658 RepID=A0A915HIV2_ROMCU